MTTGSGIAAVTHYDNAIPPFAADELERLYANPYSSLYLLDIYNGLGSDVCTYVARRGKQVVQLLLYRIQGDCLRVLNEGIKLEGADIARFCADSFARYPRINVIVFHAIEPEGIDGRTLRFPFQRHNCLEDIAMALPDSIDAYRARLGKNTRRNLKRYMDRLTRTFPTFRFDVQEREAIDEGYVRAVIGCNRSRMAAKQKSSALDETETGRILRMARTCGMVGVAFIDEMVCGGTITYRSGDNYFLYVLAHDPQYDGYWVGILTCYLTICECIKRGGKEFHFLWGRYEYKFTLGATLRNLDHLTVYRSYTRMVFNVKTALGASMQGYRRRAGLWLRYDLMQKHKMLGDLLRFALRFGRSEAGN